MKKVRKAVIPVAGLGTRFLPATKSMPKEMLTIVDRPVVQYAVDEALAAGIEHIVFVTGRNKATIEDYFDIQPELYVTLSEKGKNDQLNSLESLLPPPGSMSFTRQQSPLGLGHAIWCARDIIGDEPFAVLLPDMVCFGEEGCLSGLIDLYGTTGGNVIAVEECDPSQTGSYGIVGKGEAVGSGFAITEMVEKPAPAVAPSNFYINGRYVLQPEVFGILGTQAKGAGNEIQLTDAMLSMSETQKFYARPYAGKTFDCGSKDGFIQANVAFALQRPDIRDLVYQPISEMVESYRGRGPKA